jgi:hypothetical protein
VINSIPPDGHRYTDSLPRTESPAARPSEEQNGAGAAAPRRHAPGTGCVRERWREGCNPAAGRLLLVG